MTVVRTSRFLLLATAAFAGVLPCAAWAQGGVEEIVVTARKAEERLQDVPLAVTAFTGADMERRGIRELEDIALHTPGLVFQEFASSYSAAPVMRGLTQVNVSSEVTNVAAFVDGIYLQRNYAIDVGVADLERVEVVKGPQSALYGQNAFAGAINYVLAKPGNEFHALASVTGGSAGRFDFKVAAGGPVVADKLAVRAAFARSEYDGTWKNNFPGITGAQDRLGGHESKTYSGTARLTPTDKVEANITFFRSERYAEPKPFYAVAASDAQVKLNCGPLVNANVPNPSPPPVALSVPNSPNFICGQISTNPLTYASSRSTRPGGIVSVQIPGFHSNTNIVRAEFKAEIIENLNFVYLFGDVRSRATEITSSAVNPVDPSLTLNLGTFQTGQFFQYQKEGGVNNLSSHELRFDYASGPVKLRAGFYHAEDTDDSIFSLAWATKGTTAITDPTFTPLDTTGFPFGLTSASQHVRATALFGMASFSFLDDKATVSAEVRRNREQKGFFDGLGKVQLGAKYTTTTPRFTVDYKVTPDNLLYASAAKGVKTGGFNGVQKGAVALIPAEQIYQPESNWTYELGSKNTFMNGTLQVNADVFYIDWANQQIQGLPSNTPPALFNSTPVIYLNIGGARSYGLEGSAVYAVTKNVSLDLSGSAINPKYKNGVKSLRFKGLCDGIACPTDYSVGGKVLPRTSRYQATGGATWSDELGNDLKYFVRGEFTYQSRQFAEEMNMAWIQPRFLVNATVGLNRDFWELSVWAKNLLNKRYIADSFFVIQGGAYAPSYGEKITAGATLTLRY